MLRALHRLSLEGTICSISYIYLFIFNYGKHNNQQPNNKKNYKVYSIMWICQKETLNHMQ